MGQAQPTRQEFETRKDRVRKIVGTIMGMGYGGFVGTLLGKEVLDKPVVPSAAIGAGIGGLAGLGVGTAIGHINKYVGDHDTAHQPIQIIVPANHPQAMAHVERILAQKQASRLEAHEGVKKDLAGWLKKNLKRKEEVVDTTVPEKVAQAFQQKLQTIQAQKKPVQPVRGLSKSEAQSP
jgi:hypothetical protein